MWTLNFEPKFDYVENEWNELLFDEEHLDEQVWEEEVNEGDFAEEILAALHSEGELDFLAQQFEDEENDTNYLKMKPSNSTYYSEAA